MSKGKHAAYCHTCSKGVKRGKCKDCGDLNPPCVGCRVKTCNWTEDRGCSRLQLREGK